MLNKLVVGLREQCRGQETYPAIAQLVERLTVEVYAAIRRSLVRIRVAGLFLLSRT